MPLKRKDPRRLKRISHIVMHEQCLVYKSLGMKSWNLEKAAKAYKALLKKVHVKDVQKGFELLIHMVLVDLGSDCVDVHDQVLKGRWVKLGYTVYCRKI